MSTVTLVAYNNRNQPTIIKLEKYLYYLSSVENLISQEQFCNTPLYDIDIQDDVTDLYLKDECHVFRCTKKQEQNMRTVKLYLNNDSYYSQNVLPFQPTNYITRLRRPYI